MNKGYYIKKYKKSETELNINVNDFIEYIKQIETVNGWIRFRIYEREKPAENGLTHNMELIVYKVHNKEDSVNNTQ